MKTYRSTKEIASDIRKALKVALPQWKFSVRIHNYSGGSSITMALVSGPEAVLEARREYVWATQSHLRLPYTEDDPAPGYVQLNHYQILSDSQSEQEARLSNGEYLTETGWAVMRKACEILSAEHWDKSDAQIDYFCTNFYMHVEVGHWNRPYEVVVKR